jgi:threonine/homoserine/homoserine lactone efflux protein
MFMFGSFVTSGAVSAAGSALSAPIAGIVLGIALFVLTVILVGLADRGRKPIRQRREALRLTRDALKPMGHGRPG